MSAKSKSKPEPEWVKSETVYRVIITGEVDLWDLGNEEQNIAIAERIRALIQHNADAGIGPGTVQVVVEYISEERV